MDELDRHRENLRQAKATSKKIAASIDGMADRELSNHFLEFHKARLARERTVCAAHRAGLDVDDIAKELAIEPIAIYRILQRYETTSEGLGSA